ncbi:hypothetical protein Slin15195_G126100 [Septoria linicola]|uniref:GPI anchored serine-rich protein n=1 Tax=Septoria linicola TaxID=215465 RepID=A0A9Q9BAC8_9PEZI|nr:hypothetical protein Slin14017_G082280 [Septoria linicola]USW59291.1 hypothetical protein Slin15195_G126100 [Septoria linicola]
MRFKDILAVGAVASSASAIAHNNPLALVARDEPSISSVVVYSTRLHTVTSCGPDVTNCPIVTSVIDATTTICPVTESAGISAATPVPSTSAPVQTVTVASTKTSYTQNSTLQSPEAATPAETETVLKSTSLVYSTTTIAANGTSTVTAPAGPANSTILHSTIGSSPFSTNAVGPITAGASHSFSISANGTLATATAPGAVPIESIVPYTGSAAISGAASSLLAAMMLATCSFLV